MSMHEMIRAAAEEMGSVEAPDAEAFETELPDELNDDDEGFEAPELEDDSDADDDAEDFDADADAEDETDADEDAEDEDESETDPADNEVVFAYTDEDGNEVEVTREEARLGYLRQADYTRKRQADAEAVRAISEEFQQLVADTEETVEAYETWIAPREQVPDYWAAEIAIEASIPRDEAGNPAGAPDPQVFNDILSNFILIGTAYGLTDQFFTENLGLNTPAILEHAKRHTQLREEQMASFGQQRELEGFQRQKQAEVEQTEQATAEEAARASQVQEFRSQYEQVVQTSGRDFADEGEERAFKLALLNTATENNLDNLVAAYRLLEANEKLAALEAAKNARRTSKSASAAARRTTRNGTSTAPSSPSAIDAVEENGSNWIRQAAAEAMSEFGS
jgi:hypothetical protein